MNGFLLLFDVSPDPVGVGSWGVLILIIAIIFILAVTFAGALVFLLIWLKRRKMKAVEEQTDGSPLP